MRNYFNTLYKSKTRKGGRIRFRRNNRPNIEYRVTLDTVKLLGMANKGEQLPITIEKYIDSKKVTDIRLVETLPSPYDQYHPMKEMLSDTEKNKYISDMFFNTDNVVSSSSLLNDDEHSVAQTICF